MVYKPDEEESVIVPSGNSGEKRSPNQLDDLPSTNNDKENSDIKKKTGSEDLFNAHDFDITIDLEVPLPSKYFKFQTK